MIKLISCELYKIVHQRILLLTAVILTVLSVAYMVGTKPMPYNNYRIAAGYYIGLQGKITPQLVKISDTGLKDIDKLYHEGIRLDDKELGLNMLYKDVKAFSSYNAAYNKAVLKGKSGSLMMKRGAPDGVYYAEGWKHIMDYALQAGYIFTIVLAIYGGVVLYSSDYDSGVYSLFIASKKGRRGLLAVRMGAIAVYTALIVLWFCCVNIISNCIIYSLAGFNIPMKFLYTDTFHSMDIFQGFMVSQVVMYVVTLMFGVFSLMLVSVFKSGIPSMVTTLILLLLSFAARACSTTVEGTVKFFLYIAGFKGIIKDSPGIFFGQLYEYEALLVYIAITVLIISISFVLTMRNRA